MRDNTKLSIALAIVCGLLLMVSIDSKQVRNENGLLKNRVSVLEEENFTQKAEITILNSDIARLVMEVDSHKRFEERILKFYKSNQVSRGEPRPAIIATHKMVATAYGASVLNGGSGYGLVATGRKPVEGRTIAVDPKVIPLHSRVLVICESDPEVNGVYNAEDTGSDIKGDRADLYFDDLNEDPLEARKKMLRFGTRDITVFVLEDKKI